MKTTNQLPRLFSVIACPLFALAAVSCQTTSNPPKTGSPGSVTHPKWVKVSSQPPTYYPQGVAANYPTDHWSGEWVYTGDEKGTRYFIPLHGMGNKRVTMVHDALSERSVRKLAIIEAEDREILARNVRNQILLGPPTYAFCLMGGGAGL